MIHPASRRCLETVATQLQLLALDVPVTAECVEEGVPCIHSELHTLAREVRNALVEDASSVPYRTDVPPA